MDVRKNEGRQRPTLYQYGVTQGIGRTSMEGGRTGVGLGRNDGWQWWFRRERGRGFSGWIVMSERRTSVRWDTVDVFGPER